MGTNDTAFNNIDYKNKAIPTPNPPKVNDIDLDGTLYQNIIEASENSTIDLSNINNFTAVSQSRDDVYNMLDIMAEDPMIATALSIYASDACEPSDSGRIVWAESEDEKVLGMVEYILDQFNIDKNAYGWVYSLVKYGDLYLRLLRDSEYNLGVFNKYKKQADQLNEDITIKAFKKGDHYANYLEKQANPAEVFDLQKYGKTVGYIKTNIVSKTNNGTGDAVTNYNPFFQYNFDQGDIDIYPATDYVHACLEDNTTRNTEEVKISNTTDDEEAESYTYSVKRGQSLLYSLFRIWRELSLLENAVLLNRITKSSIIRFVNVEVGDMEKSDVRALLQRIKSMMEQKAAINKNGGTYEDYTNPGPVENTLYIPTHDGKGVISTGEMGGQVNNDDLNDVNYFRTKVFAGLGIPKQYMGFTEDSTGFNGGTSLALISSQYAKTIKRIQNAFIQAITDAVNLILLDRGLTKYINAFTIKMQSPTTQEEKDRKENLSNTINTISNIMGLLTDVENPITKLNILKSLLSSAITDVDVITALQDEIDKLEAEANGEATTEEGGEEEFGSEGGGEDFGMEAPEEGGEEGGMAPMETGEESPEAPEESFYTSSGQLLNEADNLPSWKDLGVSYLDQK